MLVTRLISRLIINPVNVNAPRCFRIHCWIRLMLLQGKRPNSQEWKIILLKNLCFVCFFVSLPAYNFWIQITLSTGESATWAKNTKFPSLAAFKSFYSISKICLSKSLWLCVKYCSTSRWTIFLSKIKETPSLSDVLLIYRNTPF